MKCGVSWASHSGVFLLLGVKLSHLRMTSSVSDQGSASQFVSEW